MSHLLPLLAALILGSLNIAWADGAKPFLHPLFTDDMVSQRGVANQIWAGPRRATPSIWP